jgi:hypothetical protein
VGAIVGGFAWVQGLTVGGVAHALRRLFSGFAAVKSKGAGLCKVKSGAAWAAFAGF